MNTEAFIKLIDKYKSITKEQLEQTYNQLMEDEETLNMSEVLTEITGFGSIYHCSLCQAAKKNCNLCLYSVLKPVDDMYACLGGTYDAIENAETIDELYDAIQNRISFMQYVLKKYNKKINKN
jgi:cystathionine beta-lyase family protein involved in aluminum resistance